MKPVFRTLLFRLVVPVLALCGWCYFTSQSLGDGLAAPYLKKQLDLAIAGHASQILKHSIPNSDTRQEEIHSAQTQFFCYLHRGSWIVKGRHKIHYNHDPDCLKDRQSLEDLSLTQLTRLFCSYVSGKRILLTGPPAFYHAQTLILEVLALHDNKIYPSRSPASGSHHFVCGDSWSEEGPSTSLTFPFNPRNASSLRRGSTTAFTRLSFSLSDILYRHDSHPWTITKPIVDPQTGIRIYYSDWVSDSQKAQILLFNKGPIPAPAWTFDGHTGNWTFTQAIPQAVSFGLRDTTITQKVVNAALHVIFQVYIPELLRALNAIPSTSKAQKIFVGSWYQQPVCTNAGLDSKFRTASLIWEKNESTNIRQVDPWTLYYNTQVYIVDQVLPVILPYFNTTYIPTTFPLMPELRGFGGPNAEGWRKRCLCPASNQADGRALQLALVRMLVYLLQDSLRQK